MARKARKNKAASKGSNASRKSKNKKNKRKQKKAMVGAKMGINKIVSDYAKLIVDPCNGPLVRSIDPHSATSLVQRVRKTISLTQSNGYALWFPSYTNGSPSGITYNRPYNLFVFETATPASVPVNTAAAPMGTGGTSGLVYNDPLYQTLATSAVGTAGTFTRAKAIAACLQLEYTGALSAAAGQVAIVRNMSMAGFVGPSIGNMTPRTVDEMFAYAATRSRLDLNGHEVKWSPTDDQQILRTPGLIEDTTVVNRQSKLVDTCFYVPTVAGTTTTHVSGPDISEMTGILIAWRDIPAGAALLNLYKVAEIEIGVGSGMLEEPKASSETGVRTSAIVDALHKLDKNWQVGSVVRDAAVGAGKMMANVMLNQVFGSTRETFAPVYTYPQSRRNLRALEL